MQPLRTKDWDRALVEFTAATFLDEEYKTKPPLSERLHEISCPGNVINPTYTLFHLLFLALVFALS